MRAKSRRTLDQYEPSGRDIRDACRRIQAGWTDHERRKRAGLPRLEPWAPPVVPSSYLSTEMDTTLDN